MLAAVDPWGTTAWGVITALMTEPTGRRRMLALGVLCSAHFLLGLDGVVVTVALPSIQHDIGLAGADAQWAITAYTLPFGGLLLLGGRLGDLLGRRRMLVVGLMVFAAASLLVGLSRSAAPFLASRAAQGVGAALAAPAALAVLTATFRARSRDLALGLLGASTDLAFVVGAVAGGVVTAALGWPWCFFLVVPLAAAGVVLVPRAVGESRDTTRPRQLDVAGALTATSGLVLLVLGFVDIERDGLAAVGTIATLAGAATVLAAFAAVERRARSPVLRLDLIRGRLGGTAMGLAANSGAFTGVTFLSTFYLQRGLGYSPLQAGLALSPLALASAVGGLISSRVIARVGARRTTVASLVVSAAALVLLSTAQDSDRDLPLLFAGYVLFGVPLACGFVSLMRQGAADVGDDDRGTAAGVLETATHVGGALVLAILATAAAGSSGGDVVGGIQRALLIAAGLLLVVAAASAHLLRSRSSR
jgi:MFS family permease